jgi:hypothetical protein
LKRQFDGDLEKLSEISYGVVFEHAKFERLVFASFPERVNDETIDTIVALEFARGASINLEFF